MPSLPQIDISGILQRIAAGAQLVALCLGAFLAAFWISLVVWTFRDIRSRTRDIFVQLLASLLVLIFNVPGLFLYLMLRPRETLAESYERQLEEEALLQTIEDRYACPTCQQHTEPDYLLCPNCHTTLKKRCPQCEHVLQLRWDICPYCGRAQASTSAPSPRPMALPEPLDVSRSFPAPAATRE